nr:RNA-directed DNA polymerase, eukaryota, reverse transcriptase zinc-binding domain protein [Tanacetum cinerariifolium]
MSFRTVDTKRICLCSFVYAFNNGKERRIIWNEINAAKIIVNEKPWCLLGDFNVTVKTKEHSSGGSNIIEDMQDFIDCLNEVEVEDIMVNQSFMTKFNSAMGHFRPFMTSDNCPVVLSNARCLNKKKRSFRFPNFIVGKEEFLPIVEKGWKEGIEGHHMFKVVKKLKMLKNQLRINGERHGFFKNGTDLRQGGPISPYLFTLVMEMFSLILARNVERRDVFKYHKGCKDMKLTHLSFVDDLLVFCYRDENFVNVIKDALLEFGKVSGLLLNIDKSVIFFGSVKENEKKMILQSLPFKVGKLPVRCLGIPLLAKRNGIKEYVVKIPKTIVNEIDKSFKEVPVVQ